jgi:hypothetical protein
VSLVFVCCMCVFVCLCVSEKKVEIGLLDFVLERKVIVCFSYKIKQDIITQNCSINKKFFTS